LEERIKSAKLNGKKLVGFLKRGAFGKQDQPGIPRNRKKRIEGQLRFPWEKEWGKATGMTRRGAKKGKLASKRL